MTTINLARLAAIACTVGLIVLGLHLALSPLDAITVVGTR